MTMTTHANAGLRPEELRKQFPALSRTVNGKKLVYLDNGATTQKPLCVLEAMDRYYREYNSNVHRGIHRLSEEATEAYDSAHETIAGFIGAHSWQEVIFTKNTTESLNLVARSLLPTFKKGDEVLLTQMEHHSNIVPWQQLAKQHGLVVRYIPVTDEGILDLLAARKMLSAKTKLVSLTHVSNVLGTINPVREVAGMAHDHGALCVVDAAQSVPHMPVSVQELGCDFLAFSGHKMAGPTGIGVLWGRTELLERMQPFLYGGDMISSVSFQDAEWNELPWKFEAGTPVIAEGIGLAEAARFLTGIGMDSIQRHEQALARHACEALGSLKGVRIFGPRERAGLVSFWADPVHPHDLASLLDQDGIAIRAGHHCAMPLVVEVLKQPALARASFYLYNTKEEIDALAAGVKKAQKVFG